MLRTWDTPQAQHHAYITAEFMQTWIQKCADGQGMLTV